MSRCCCPPSATWESNNSRKPNYATTPTRRLVDAVKNNTATALRHLRIAGVFANNTLGELGKLTALVSLDITLYCADNWTLLEALVGREEDGQTYARLKHLRHFRLHVQLAKQAEAAMAADCHLFVRALRTILSTHADQLETVDTVTVPSHHGRLCAARPLSATSHAGTSTARAAPPRCG